jgi:hypothetical protein
MGHPRGLWLVEENGSRLRANAHISESRYGAPGFVVDGGGQATATIIRRGMGRGFLLWCL